MVLGFFEDVIDQVWKDFVFVSLSETSSVSIANFSLLLCRSLLSKTISVIIEGKTQSKVSRDCYDHISYTLK